MINSLHLKNLQKHKEFNVDFSPSFTSILGINEAGKSPIRRDVSWILYDYQKGKGIIEKFGDVVFFDLKKTFFTAEMKDGGNIEIFKARQKEIAEELQKLVEKSGLNDSVEVHQDTIAVNVKNKKLNKHLATQKFLEWLAIKKIEPDTFYVFGDSASDLQIGEELNNQGKKIKFIYTGAEDLGSLPFEIIKTQAKFDQGTVEYLLSKVQ